MKTLIAAAALTLVAAPGWACPWASQAFRATVPPDLSFEFIFDASCDMVSVQLSGKDPKTTKAMKSNAGWTITSDGYTFVFDTKGKRARGSQGGASRSLKLKRL